jgi:hypothetical protein
MTMLYLQVGRNVVICCVDQRLVKVDQQNKFPVYQQTLFISLTQDLSLLTTHNTKWS